MNGSDHPARGFFGGSREAFGKPDVHKNISLSIGIDLGTCGRIQILPTKLNPMNSNARSTPLKLIYIV